MSVREYIASIYYLLYYTPVSSCYTHTQIHSSKVKHSATTTDVLSWSQERNDNYKARKPGIHERTDRLTARSPVLSLSRQCLVSFLSLSHSFFCFYECETGVTLGLPCCCRCCCCCHSLSRHLETDDALLLQLLLLFLLSTRDRRCQQASPVSMQADQDDGRWGFYLPAWSLVAAVNKLRREGPVGEVPAVLIAETALTQWLCLSSVCREKSNFPRIFDVPRSPDKKI